MSTRHLLPFLMALGASVLAPVPAQATYETLASGQTKLIFERGFLASLKSEGVSLKAIAPARRKGDSVSFPVIAGKLDPTTGKGVIEHAGTLLFEAGERSIPLRDLQLKTTQMHSPLSAKVGGSQMKLGTARNIEASRSGFGEKVSVSRLALSSKLAIRLAKKLARRRLFKTGTALARTVSRTTPQAIALAKKNKAELTFDQGFEAKLSSLFVAVNPIFPAEHPGAFTLPLFAGSISPDASQGTIETQGSLEFLQLGGGQVFWREDWIDLAAKALAPEAELLPSPPYAGKQDRESVASLALLATTVSAKERTVSVTGSLSLSASTAESFNEIFAKPLGKGDVFVPGEALGAVTFTAQGQ